MEKNSSKNQGKGYTSKIGLVIASVVTSTCGAAYLETKLITKINVDMVYMLP